jgi:hypothetical protein
VNQKTGKESLIQRFMNNKKEIQFNTVNINEKTEEICVYKLGKGKGTEKSGDDKNLDLG